MCFQLWLNESSSPVGLRTHPIKLCRELRQTLSLYSSVEGPRPLLQAGSPACLLQHQGVAAPLSSHCLHPRMAST